MGDPYFVRFCQMLRPDPYFVTPISRSFQILGVFLAGFSGSSSGRAVIGCESVKYIRFMVYCRKILQSQNILKMG